MGNIIDWMLMSFSSGSRISHRGGMDLIWGGMDSQGGYFLKILYVKTKESGPLGGHALGTPPSRSANDNCKL